MSLGYWFVNKIIKQSDQQLLLLGTQRIDYICQARHLWKRVNSITITTNEREERTNQFFSDMLNKTQAYFYGNKNVWPKFGYEGSSWEKGGYINRGFNDLDWL